MWPVATDLDTAHEGRVKRLLMGMILAAKDERSGALEHMRRYLDPAPKTQDAARVRRPIDQLQPLGDAK